MALFDVQVVLGNVLVDILGRAVATLEKYFHRQATLVGKLSIFVANSNGGEVRQGNVFLNFFVVSGQVGPMACYL